MYLFSVSLRLCASAFLPISLYSWYHHSSLITDITQAQQHTARTSHDLRAVCLPGALLLATVIFSSMD
jgi:hypothetical protein